LTDTDMADNNVYKTDLSVKVGRICLKNPVITCSGSFAGGIEYSKFYDISKLGAVTTKSFSLKKKEGNPSPRVWETASGMLNSIGLQNEGIDFFISTQLQEIKNLGAEIILSIFGESEDEFKKIALKIKPVLKQLKAVELNYSCPNVKAGGMAFCGVPENIKTITSEIKSIIDIPLIAKLSPNFGSVIACAIQAKKGGADAVSVINTITGTAFDINTFKPRLANIVGGLSGPAIKPAALLQVYQLAKEKVIPVIGMGGIYYWQDAVEFLIAGATAIGIGTVNFSEPDAGEKIISGINEYLISKKISSINKIIGKAL
jgi:dihydroorotate dehydrogenase (NAD+) catalytic subunit